MFTPPPPTSLPDSPSLTRVLPGRQPGAHSTFSLLCSSCPQVLWVLTQKYNGAANRHSLLTFSAVLPAPNLPLEDPAAPLSPQRPPSAPSAPSPRGPLPVLCRQQLGRPSKGAMVPGPESTPLTSCFSKVLAGSYLFLFQKQIFKKKNIRNSMGTDPGPRAIQSSEPHSLQAASSVRSPAA